MSAGAPIGRPSSYTQEKGDSICEQLATSSLSLRSICEQDGMPTVKTVLNWLTEGGKQDGAEWAKAFLRQYTHARELQADFLAEEILEISDDASNDFMTITKGDKTYNVENKEVTNRSRLRVDARKWVASKLKPKKYGEKLDVTTDGEKVNAPLITTMLDGKVIDLKAKE